MKYIVEYNHNSKYLFCPICKNNFSFDITEHPGFLAELHKGIHDRENLDTPEIYANLISEYKESHFPYLDLYTDLDGLSTDFV